MKGFLGLAADFIERMANPAYGTQVNESYGLRFTQLLAHDREMVGALTHLDDLQARDLSLLSTDGWLWLLGWMKSHGTRPPDPLLHSLFDTTNYLVLRLKIVEAVTTTASLERGREPQRWPRYDIQEFPESWLRTRMERALTIRKVDTNMDGREDTRRAEPGDLEGAVAEAFELTTLLLQVGDEIAMSASRSLLAHRWGGAELLRENIAQLFSGLDEETRRSWYSELGLEWLR